MRPGGEQFSYTSGLETFITETKSSSESGASSTHNQSVVFVVYHRVVPRQLINKDVYIYIYIYLVYIDKTSAKRFVSLAINDKQI